MQNDKENDVTRIEFSEKDGYDYTAIPLDDKVYHVRVDKLVYSTLVDGSLDLLDESWTVGHKDGDIKNCKSDNLYLIKE